MSGACWYCQQSGGTHAPACPEPAILARNAAAAPAAAGGRTLHIWPLMLISFIDDIQPGDHSTAWTSEIQGPPFDRAVLHDWSEICWEALRDNNMAELHRWYHKDLKKHLRPGAPIEVRAWG